MLTALMFYFGVLHAYWFFGRLGVEYTIFELTLQDYLFRSADGLFIPLTIVSAVGLVVVWTARLLPARLYRLDLVAVVTMLTTTLAVIGIALLSVAAIGLVTPEVLRPYVAVPGLALSIGVGLLLAASRLHRRSRQRRAGSALQPEPLAMHAAEWTAVFLLGTVGLFWAAGDWSAAVGTARANQVVATLGTWPDALLFSDKPLNLSTAGVRETRCSGAEENGGYRYDGMHLIVQAGGHYLFLPTDWPSSGQAIVIPRTDDLRLVFTTHGASRSQTC